MFLSRCRAVALVGPTKNLVDRAPEIGVEAGTGELSVMEVRFNQGQVVKRRRFVAVTCH